MYVVLEVVMRQVQVRERAEMRRVVVEHLRQVCHRLAGDAALRQRDVTHAL